MIEKKMTDEDIVKTLEYCVKHRETCEDCTLEYKACDDDNFVIAILDLIHRLQSENEGLKAKSKLDQMDIEDLQADREKRVEEVYADFMKDYKIMRDELNSCQNELAEYERKPADEELDIALYLRGFEEGDNITVTCDLLNAMEQAVALFNKQKSKIEVLKTELQKSVKNI